MDNEALMRRIAAATEAQRQRASAQEKAAQARPVQRAVLSSAPAPEGPSHLASVLGQRAPYEGPDRRIIERPQPGPTPMQPTAHAHHHAHDATQPVNAAHPSVQQPQVAAAPVQAGHVTPPQAAQPVAHAVAPAEMNPAYHPVQPDELMEQLAQQTDTHGLPNAGGVDPHAHGAQVESHQTPPMVPPAETPASFAAESVQAVLDSDAPINDEEVGILTSCDGINATLRTAISPSVSDVAVGQMVTIENEGNRVIGLIYQLSRRGDESVMFVHIELQGEIRQSAAGELSFHKGIAKYPGIGSPARRIGAAELASIYATSGNRNAVVGSLAQEESIPAYVDIEAMLSKHFAVLGSTGSGKSSAVSLLLRACAEVVPDMRVLFMDPHNEYASAFPEANVIDSSNLELPFWMFQLEEYVEVLFRGKPGNNDEVDALREFIPEAKQKFRDGEERTSLRADNGGSLTADTPAPYRISDMLAIIDEELGMLEPRYSRGTLKALRARIIAHGNDPRYRFMFRDKTITDRSDMVLESFFNLTGQRTMLTIFQMAGLPSEVVNAVASVLCRLAFELCIAAEGGLKILMVCEEAHRYVPDNPVEGFGPTRRAIARIAKEGRKYGSFISIISQRPAELDPTILSQCSTVFALRMSNENDQILIRKAISSSSASTISFLSSLANREAIAFGEGLSTPMRLRFKTLPKAHLPGQTHNVFDEQYSQPTQLTHVLQNWRGLNGAASATRQHL